MSETKTLTQMQAQLLRMLNEGRARHQPQTLGTIEKLLYTSLWMAPGVAPSQRWLTEFEQVVAIAANA
jgi:hypothetical protein